MLPLILIPAFGQRVNSNRGDDLTTKERQRIVAIASDQERIPLSAAGEK